MKNFSVQVTWSLSATVEVQAENAGHAKELVEAGHLPSGNYVHDSFEVLDVNNDDEQLAADNANEEDENDRKCCICLEIYLNCPCDIT